MKNSWSNLHRIRDEAIESLNDLIKSLEIRQKQTLFAQCICLFDTSWYFSSIEGANDNKKLFYDEIIRFGYPVFINMFYDNEFLGLDDFGLEALDNTRIQLCREILITCRIIGRIEYFFDCCKSGHAKSYRILNLTRIKFTQKYRWIEFSENRYKDLYSQIMIKGKKSDYDSLFERQPIVLEKMSKCVYIWKNDFMGYSSDEETEFFFQKFAYLDLLQETEWDMFSEDSQFSGIAYIDYIYSIVDFVGYTIKHIYFMGLLQNRYPNLLTENLAFCLFLQDDLIRLISENRAVDKDKATLILSAMTLARRDNEDSSKQSINSCAPFIKVSKNQYIRSIAGLHDHPFIFLLNQLKKCYPTDWERNTLNREATFKEQLYSLFGEGFKCIPNNISIEEEGRIVTDIDAAIVNMSNGEIALFQLKWQEHASGSLFSLASKARNYQESTAEWIQKVKKWLATCSEKELSQKLGVKAKHINKSKIFIFILGRHYGNYSSKTTPDLNCAWVQWYQLLYLVTFIGARKNIISELYKTIVLSNPFLQKTIEPPAIYKFGSDIIIFGGNLRGLKKYKFNILSV